MSTDEDVQQRKNSKKKKEVVKVVSFSSSNCSPNDEDNQAYNDHGIQVTIFLIPRLTSEQVTELFYSQEEINQMKDVALMEDAGVTTEGISTKGQDMFQTIKILGETMPTRNNGFKRSSLQRVAVRDISPMTRSPTSSPTGKKQDFVSKTSTNQRNVPIDLGNTLFPNNDKGDPSSRPPPQRERRPRGGNVERGIRRARSSNMAPPSRTDTSLTSSGGRRREGRATLQRGAVSPRRAKSGFVGTIGSRSGGPTRGDGNGPTRGGGGGGDISDVAQMQAALASKLGSSSSS